MSSPFEIYQEGSSFYSTKTESFNLASKSFIGESKSGKIIYSLFEVLYLLEEKKAVLINSKNKKISFKELANKQKKEIHDSYRVFKDLKTKGLIVKEGLKFGTDFRVYEKSAKPGKDHAKYLLSILERKSKLKLQDFCAKARIAHSTAKTLLLAIIDSERDINYYEVNWKNIA